MTVLENLGISIIVWTCVYHILGVNMEVGYVYVFITYIKQLFEPITRIIENVEVVEEATVSMDKIYAILDKEEYLEDLDEGIELKDRKSVV